MTTTLTLQEMTDYISRIESKVSATNSQLKLVRQMRKLIESGNYKK